jgi:hypothetical protein
MHGHTFPEYVHGRLCEESSKFMDWIIEPNEHKLSDFNVQFLGGGDIVITGEY